MKSMVQQLYAKEIFDVAHGGASENLADILANILTFTPICA
jgi:hypothetical protein